MIKYKRTTPPSGGTERIVIMKEKNCLENIIRDLKQRGPGKIEIIDGIIIIIWSEGFKIPIEAEYSLDGKKIRERFIAK